MNTLDRLSELLQMPSLIGVISDIQKATTDIGVDFFGIGALARNVWYVSNGELPRGTKDLDFAVYVPNADVYESLKERLVSCYGYQPSSGSAFCLLSPDRVVVDLLPFGEIERQGKVIVEGTGLISIGLAGFAEVYKRGMEKAAGNEGLKVCSIPSVVLLKLIAYDDRPEHRHRDPLDIASILTHYPAIEAELIWQDYNFLYEGEREHDEVGVMVIGYKIAEITFTSQELVRRINTILNSAITGRSDLAKRMVRNPEEDTIKSQQELLRLLQIGLNEGLHKAAKK